MSQPIVQFETTALALVAQIDAEFDAAALLRGSDSSAVAALAIGKRSGIFTANDRRRSLGIGPLASEDVLATAAAVLYPPDAQGLPALHPSPGPAANWQAGALTRTRGRHDDL
jgi:hypothetical protein